MGTETQTMRNSNNKEQNLEEKAALQKLNARIKQSEDEATKIVYTGFAAQEVEAVAQKLNYNFSGIDKPKSKDGLYGLRYSDFVIPLVKAVQEVSAELNTKDEKIASQQKEIDELKQQVQEIKEALLKGGVPISKIKSQSLILSSTLLEQNAPNPFNRMTTIRYQLPESFSSASIVISDKNGKTLKQVKVSGTGYGMITIDASTLSAGAYNYSLYIDEKLIATKRMILTR